jgi:septum formation protein
MIDQGPQLLLCSASPRRRDLLGQLGLAFEIRPAHLDEARRPGESPRGLAERLAREKALAGLHGAPQGSVALAADTVVAIGDEDFGKPRDRRGAERMLRALAGRTHTVLTGVCAASSSKVRSILVETLVRFVDLDSVQIAWLAASGDGDDKAGAYAVQGLAGAFIDRLEGSCTNVVGLPVAETVALLQEMGVRMPWQK